MKERPILFSGPMVRALLEGRKTQTRRVCKGQREKSNEHDFQLDRCPHGIVGDRLWVRESWAPAEAALPLLPGVLYRADYHTGLEKRDGDRTWKPSIHMKRQDSRLTLEITGVRVERLQEISDVDCRDEGCCHRGWDATNWKHPHNESGWNIERANFASLWSSINGQDSWSSNPWVWVIEFRRIEQ